MRKIVSKKLIENFKKRFQKYQPISTRSMFGGYGLCHHTIMFALVFDGVLYLRADESLMQDFEELGMTRLIFDKRGLPLLLNYYEISQTQWQDDALMNIYIMRAISGAIFDKNKKDIEKQQRIKDLPNMTPSLERSLWRVGIKDIEQLQQIGAIAAYQRLKQSQQGLTVEILFLLEAALLGCHIAVLSAERKQRLLQALPPEK